MLDAFYTLFTLGILFTASQLPARLLGLVTQNGLVKRLGSYLLCF